MGLISDKVKEVSPSGIRKFFDLVMSRKDVISLGVGEPDFVTPWHIREACVYSLEQGYTMYTSNFGLLELRQEISSYIKNEYSLRYSPKKEILVTVGVSEALDLALRAVVNPGDEIVIPEPSYVSYKPCTTLAGGKPVILETKVSDDFQVNSKELQKIITSKTKVIILGYPNNPTGAIMPRSKLEEIAKIALKHNLIIISDEIYDQLTYVGKHTSIATLPGMKERTILLRGFSKSYAMTCWRIGYALSNPKIIEAMMKIHQYTMLCAPIMGQKGAIEALRNGNKEMEEMVEEYNQRRKVVVKGLNEIGLFCFEPKGAFYAFPSIKKTGLSSEEFCQRLLKEENVAVVPGTAFGECGEGYVRLSYAASLPDINEALSRMGRFVRKYQHIR